MITQNALIQSLPLIQLCHTPSLPVPLYLYTPLIESTSEKKRKLWIELFHLISLYELYLIKQAQLQSAPTTASTESVQLVAHKVAECQSKIQNILSLNSKTLDGHTDLQSLLQATGLHTVFEVAAGVVPPLQAKSAPVKGPRYDLKGITILNQVVSLSLQLRQDVDLTNHKYMAHQVALLYQSLSNSREDLRTYRTKIEAQFDAIKATCSAAVPEPRLSPEQREWLYNITTEILTEALFKGKDISSSKQVMAFLRSI